MPPSPRKRTNKQYLLPPYNSQRVSRRTKQRWKVVFEKSSDRSKYKDDQNHSSIDKNNISSELLDDSNESMPDLNTCENLNPNENQHSSSAEISDSDNSSSYSESSFDDDSYDNWRNFSTKESDSSLDNDYDSSSDSSSNCSSNNTHPSSGYNFTGFNTDHFHGNNMMFPQAQLSVADVLFMVTAYSIRKNLTKKDEDDLIDLIKILAGPQFASWNASQYARAKAYDPPKSKTTTHFFCTTCNIILTTHNNGNKMNAQSVKCKNCEDEYKLTSESSNQFITVDLSYQFQTLLNDEVIQQNLLQTLDLINNKNKVDGIIDNIYDSQLYESLQRLSPQTLTYNINTDGAPPFKSSNRSFWPIQLSLNELSPQVRMQNIVLGGMLLTSIEPSPGLMKLYLSKFIDDAEKLMTQGIDITMHNSNEPRNFKLHCFLICVDSVARPVIQNRYQYSGYNGCSWCYDHGEYYSSAVRYPITESDPILRTQEGYVNDVKEVEQQARHIKGVKGRSEFLRLKHIDCVWSFPVDYMHGVLLGVTRQLWSIWTTPKTSYYLTPSNRKEIDKRLLQIKRPHEIHRLVRSIKTTAKWKAAEWESWLLFDSLACLDGILKKECFDSYCLLVSSIFKLLSGNITEKCILECEINLLQFVGECQQFYGKSVMTFNMHSLLHIGQSVRLSGPLCSSNTFIFENSIFYYKREINAAHGVAQQIITSTLKKNHILHNINNGTESVTCRDYCKKLFFPQQLTNYSRTNNGAMLTGRASEPTERVKSLIRDLHIPEVYSCKVYSRCILKNTILRSIKYTRPQKTDDTVILLNSNKKIQIYDFVVVNNTCYIYGHELVTVPLEFGATRLNHMFEVVNRHDEEIFVDANNLEAKLVFFTTGTRGYVSLLPQYLGV